MEIPVRMPETRTDASNWESSLGLFSFGQSTRVFAHYVAAIADYSATYAGLAGIMTAQIFLYLMAVVLILGAEINAELENRNQ